MSWEQEIIEKLREVSSVAVRFDTNQNLTTAQKTTAKNNVGIGSTFTQVADDDYKITLNY